MASDAMNGAAEKNTSGNKTLDPKSEAQREFNAVLIKKQINYTRDFYYRVRQQQKYEYELMRNGEVMKPKPNADGTALAAINAGDFGVPNPFDELVEGSYSFKMKDPGHKHFHTNINFNVDKNHNITLLPSPNRDRLGIGGFGAPPNVKLADWKGFFHVGSVFGGMRKFTLSYPDAKTPGQVNLQETLIIAREARAAGVALYLDPTDVNLMNRLNNPSGNKADGRACREIMRLVHESQQHVLNDPGQKKLNEKDMEAKRQFCTGESGVKARANKLNAAVEALAKADEAGMPAAMKNVDSAREAVKVMLNAMQEDITQKSAPPPAICKIYAQGVAVLEKVVADAEKALASPDLKVGADVLAKAKEEMASLRKAVEVVRKLAGVNALVAAERVVVKTAELDKQVRAVTAAKMALSQCADDDANKPMLWQALKTAYVNMANMMADIGAESKKFDARDQVEKYKQAIDSAIAATADVEGVLRNLAGTEHDEVLQEITLAQGKVRDSNSAIGAASTVQTQVQRMQSDFNDAADVQEKIDLLSASLASEQGAVDAVKSNVADVEQTTDSAAPMPDITAWQDQTDASAIRMDAIGKMLESVKSDSTANGDAVQALETARDKLQQDLQATDEKIRGLNEKMKDENVNGQGLTR